MKTEELAELKGLVGDLFAEQIKKSEEAAAKRFELWHEEFKKENSKTQGEVLKRLEAIERTPMVKRAIEIPGAEGRQTEIFLGVKMSKQFRDIEVGQRLQGAQKYLSDPQYFPVMANAEKKEKFAKHLVMVLKASQGDFKAKQAYEEWREKADLAEGSGATGGYLVPDEFSDEILAFARLKSFALQDCRIWPMSSDVRRVPSEASAVTVSHKAEAAAADASDPTFGEVVLTAKRLTAYTEASNELLADSSVDIVSYLTEIFAEATGQELDNQVLNGTGDPVSGVLTAAAGYSTIMSTGLSQFSAISADNLADMIDKIPQQAEDGAKFYFHKNILTYIRKLKDTTNQYIFAPVAGGLPTDIWSYPYVRTPKGPARSASAASTAFVVFANMRYFMLGRRADSMALSIDPYGKFLESQTRFKVESRWGYGIGLANAFSRLITAA